MRSLDLEQQIITSEEAEAFLQMVTKGFYSQSYAGLWIYEVIGREWDEMRAWAEGMKNEINPQTCTWSIAIWEWVAGIETDETVELDIRRQRVLAKISSVRPINPEIIRRGVAVLIGASAETVEVNDLVGPYRFEVVVQPQGKPIQFGRINKYVKDTKPSHLAFETTLETRVEIKVLIATEWYLSGYGLTGLYNAGQRPNTNIKAKLHDITVEAGIDSKGAIAPRQNTGTVYTTAQGTNPQKMPTPSVIFRQDSAEVDAYITAAGYKTNAPTAAESNSEAGRYPHTQIIGRQEDTGISAEIDGKATAIPYTPAGTQPDTQLKLGKTGGGIVPQIQTESYTVKYPMCGTKITKSDR